MTAKLRLNQSLILRNSDNSDRTRVTRELRATRHLWTELFMLDNQ